MIGKINKNELSINMDNEELIYEKLKDNKIIKEENMKDGKMVSFNKKEVDRYITNNISKIYKIKDDDIFFISNDLINEKYFCYNKKRIHKWFLKHDLYIILEKKMYLSKYKPVQGLYGQVLNREKSVNIKNKCNKFIFNGWYESEGYIIVFSKK